MSRLFYPPQTRPGFQAATNQNGKTAETLEKIAKIIPAEIIAGYLAIIGWIPLIKDPSLHQTFYYIAFAAGAFATPFYMNWQSENGHPKKIHIILSTFAFIFWAYSSTGEKVFHSIFDSAIASILLILFSWVSGKIPLK